MKNYYNNGTLKVPIRRKDYLLTQKDLIMFNGNCWQIITQKDSSGKSLNIGKSKIKYFLDKGFIIFKETRKCAFSEVDIYVVRPSGEEDK